MTPIETTLSQAFGHSPMDAEYLQLMDNMLQYWLRETADISDRDLDRLNAEITNINQTIEQGLSQPETVPLTADLLIQTKLLSERRGYWYKWHDHIQTALTFDSLTPSQRTQLLNQIGFLCNFLSRLDDAIIYHQAARDLAQQNNLYDQWARAEANLCNDYRLTYQYELGEASGRAAIALCEEQRITNWLQAYANARLGSLYREWGKFEQVLPLLKNAEAKFSLLKDRTFLGVVLLDIGLTFGKKGDLKTALELMLQAKSMLKEVNNIAEVAKVNWNLGWLYGELEKFELSIEYSQDAFKTFQKLNLQFDMASVAINLTEFFIHLDQYLQASYYLDIGIPIFESLNDKLNLANTKSILGYIQAQAGEIANARVTYAQGLSLLEDIPHSHFKEIVANELKERANAL